MALNSYDEIGTPTYKVTRNGATGTQTFKIPWDQIDAVVAELFPPFAAPRSFPGRVFMYATDVDIEPWMPDSPTGLGEIPAEYEFARITINYSTLSFDQDPATQNNNDGSDSPGGDDQKGPGKDEDSDATFLSFRTSIGGEYITYPSGALEWTSDQEDVTDEVQAGVVVPIIEHSVTWHNCALPPWAKIRATVGRVNNAQYFGAGVGTLLFLGVEASRELTSDGEKQWELEYRFSEKNVGTEASPKGWNYFLRPDADPVDFESVALKGTSGILSPKGVPPYEEVSFPGLFALGF